MVSILIVLLTIPFLMFTADIIAKAIFSKPHFLNWRISLAFLEFFVFVLTYSELLRITISGPKPKEHLNGQRSVPSGE